MRDHLVKTTVLALLGLLGAGQHHYYCDHPNPQTPVIGAKALLDKCNQQQKYKPEGPVGIRYKKQILSVRDLTSGTFDSHMLESAFKKKHFQQMFFLDDPSFFEDDFQLQQLCPSFLDPSMMPNDLFTEKADVIFDAFCALPAEPEGIPAATFISSVYYKPKHTYIGSSQASGAIHIQTTEEADIPKDNSYLNLALGVKAAFELPAGALDALDQEQTIEGFLFKKAKQNNVDNYHILR